MPYAFVDIESRSAIDLAERGLGPYLACKSTRPISVVVLTDIARVWVNAEHAAPLVKMPLGEVDSPVPVELTYSREVPKWLRAMAKSHTFVGHNSTDFDDPFMRRVIGVEATWLDTLPLARQAGLPGGLDAIGKALFGGGKHEGKAVLPKFFDASKKFPYHLLWALVSYNIADCVLTRDLFDHLTPWLPSREVQLLEVHNTINERGIGVDLKLCTAITNISLEAQERAGDEIEAMSTLKRTDLRSRPKMLAWLARMGFTLQNMRKESVDALLADPDRFFDEEGEIDLPSVLPIVPAVLRLRKVMTRTTGGKVARIELRTDADSRLRRMLVYHGAHTGRWTSRAVQLHNMHRGVKKCDVPALLAKPLTYARIAAEAARLRKAGQIWVSADDILATLLRYVFVPRPGRWLSSIDFNAIECRGAAWLAGEEKLLAAFRENRDVYCEFGATLFGRAITKKDETERQVSKVVVLGCQYGLGAGKLGYYAAAQGVDLAAAGVTAQQCIDLYRDTYTRIAGVRDGNYRSGGIWKAYGAAAFDALDNRSTLAGKCLFEVRAGNLTIKLPSGRTLTYRDARVENVVPSWGGEARPAVTYANQYGFRKSVYGGLLCENVTQAICRDLLADALVRLEAKADVVLHVHDEIVSEVDSEAEHAELCHLMQSVPQWASGFPVTAEGSFSRRYGKQRIS